MGVATHEARLTELVREQPERVLEVGGPPSAVVLLEEVEIGIGRPDLLLLRIDLQALDLRRHAGLRLHNLAEARVLGAILNGRLDQAGVSAEHTRRLVGRLADKGWLELTSLTSVVLDSVLLEAKVSHWGVGVQQLARVRWASNRAALLVPTATASRVSRQSLAANRLGLLSEEDGLLVWEQAPTSVELPPHYDAWLGEMALRKLSET